MSIIEETLRTIQEKQETKGHGYKNPGVSSVNGNVSHNPKPANYKTFVILTIVLSVLGLATYVGFDMYQNKLEEKKRILNYDQDLFKAEITSIVKSPKPPTTIKHENKLQKPDLGLAKYIELEKRLDELKEKDKAPGNDKNSLNTKISSIVEAQKPSTSIKPDSKPQKSNKQSDISRQRSLVLPFESPQSPQLPQPPISPFQPPRSTVLADQVFGPLKENTQKGDIVSLKTTNIAKPDQETYITPIVKERKAKPKTNEIALESKQHKLDGQPDVAKDAVLSQEPSGPADTLKPPESTPTSLLVEEYVIEKQLNRAKDLVNAGSCKEAIEVLKPVIDSPSGTWEAYLLMGAAYLSLGELYYAETYLDMGLAINRKQPQLWVQRAIVEQQRGEHEAALRILHESEKLAPTMPKVLLNIGYSNDAIGNKQLAAKSYQSFLGVTEGKPAYSVVRLKVLDRLASLK